MCHRSAHSQRNLILGLRVTNMRRRHIPAANSEFWPVRRQSCVGRLRLQRQPAVLVVEYVFDALWFQQP
jgi:hypothetical protein